MDTAHQWPQIVVKPIEQIVTNNIAPSSSCPKQQQQTQNINGGLDHQRINNNNNNKVAIRPQKEQALNCPRCNSTNTKFCYYNNYSLTQPRYFCKTCRRYWTEGGSLRNIPVGGGSRKNKRPSSSSSSSSPSSLISSKSNKLPDLVSSYQNQNPKSTIVHDHQAGQDLNLSFSDHFRSSSSALELLTGITSNSRVGNFSSFLNSTSVPVQDYTTTGFSLQEFKPASLSFSLDGLGNGGFGSSDHHLHQESSSGGRLLFPFEDLKQIQSSANLGNENRDHQQGDGNISSGFWSGMMGGGGGGDW